MSESIADTPRVFRAQLVGLDVGTIRVAPKAFLQQHGS
jgi:hypothetical protein